jgi:hypothetical protein
MSCGRLEAQWTLATSQTMTLNVTGIGGPYTVTISAGSRYPTGLVAEIQTQLDAATGADGAFTVSMSKTDETGTGIVTIAHATQTFTLAFTSATFRAALGFAGDLTPAALTFSGTSTMAGVWLPDCPIDSTYGREAGHSEGDRSTMVTPTGNMSGLHYATRVVHPEIRWSHVSRARAREAAETTDGLSFESWFRDTHLSRVSTFVPVCPKVLIYDDSTGETVVGYFYLTRPVGDTAMEKAAAPWHGLFTVVIGGYQVPS